MAHARRRRSAAEAPENHERWLLTYADLITLLMVFFVVLYSMSRADSEKFQRVSAALERAFNVDVMKGESASSIGEGGEAEAQAPSVAIVERVVTHVAEMSPEAAQIKQRLESASRATAQAPEVSVVANREGVVVRVSGSYLFDSGRAELKPQALPTLDALAAELRKLSHDVRIEGHTDTIPVDSPRYATNWELSTARALAVTRYLSESGGVHAWRLAAAGYGEFHPIANNETREGRSLNRRVEIRVLTASSADAAAAGAAMSRSPLAVAGGQP